MKKEFVNKVLEKLGDGYSQNQRYEIEQALILCLANYNMEEIGQDLVPYSVDEKERLFKLFLINKKIEGCTDNTLRFYAAEIRRLGYFCKKQWADVTTDDIRLYLAHLSMERHCSKTTQDNSLRVYRSFFGWLSTEEHIPKDPTARIKKIKTEKKVKKPFSEIEIEKLRNGARNPRERAVVEVLLSTGVRVSEMERMNRADLDGDQMIVHGKGEKERYVYLNAKAIVALGNYLETRNDDKPALFVSFDKPYDRLKKSSIETMVRELGKELGIDNVHPHRFRRTAATVALNRGMPIDQVQQMLGHEQIATTTIYAKTLSESVKASHKKYLA